LNQTFTQIQPLIKISSYSYTAADHSVYNISDIAVRLRYIDSKQKAEIMGKNTIAIVGGYL
jgi:hypothetical protein